MIPMIVHDYQTKVTSFNVYERYSLTKPLRPILGKAYAWQIAGILALDGIYSGLADPSNTFGKIS
jgi:hypothetical protein